MSTAVSVATGAGSRYVPRGRNELNTIFEHHFDDFCEQYDTKYTTTHGMYRLERFQQLGERFRTCGDYLQGVARIRSTNPECGHNYFRPFSCKGFYLCPFALAASPICFHPPQSTTPVFPSRSTGDVCPFPGTNGSATARICPIRTCTPSSSRRPLCQYTANRDCGCVLGRIPRRTAVFRLRREIGFPIICGTQGSR